MADPAKKSVPNSKTVVKGDQKDAGKDLMSGGEIHIHHPSHQNVLKEGQKPPRGSNAEKQTKKSSIIQKSKSKQSKPRGSRAENDKGGAENPRKSPAAVKAKPKGPNETPKGAGESRPNRKSIPVQIQPVPAKSTASKTSNKSNSKPKK